MSGTRELGGAVKKLSGTTGLAVVSGMAVIWAPAVVAQLRQSRPRGPQRVEVLSSARRNLLGLKTFPKPGGAYHIGPALVTSVRATQAPPKVFVRA